MIFVTVGTQLPFDRLIDAVAHWSEENNQIRVTAQVGPSKRPLPPTWVAYQFMNPREYALAFDSAEIIVSHAGMGTILTALHRRKPLLIMPRSHSLGEHRNDHQLSTSRALSDTPGIKIVTNFRELKLGLEQPPRCDSGISEFAAPDFISAIRNSLIERHKG